MKIGIDISLLCLPKTGVGQYRYNLVKALLEKRGDSEEIYLYGFNYRLFDVFQGLGFEEMGAELDIKKFPNRAASIWWNFFNWPKIEKCVENCDVYHLSETGFQPSNKLSVATIHDLTIEKFPELHLGENKFFSNLRHKRLAKSNAHLIAVSESTKQDFVDYYGVNPARISVVHHGVSPEYKPEINNTEVKAKYGIEGEYFLYLGTIEPRKNLVRVLEAFREFKKNSKSGLKLVLAGGLGWGYEEVLALAGEMKQDVILTGYVDEKDKPALLCGAECLVYASLYEGFGLPVLEAMACGLPVITSQNSGMSEVAGDAAIFVNPETSMDIYEALVEISKNGNLAGKLSQKGIERAKCFSWEKCAEETKKVYKSIAQE